MSGTRAKTFETVTRSEQIKLKARRKALGVADDKNVAGLALSGGGIRSATFSLGFLQALSARGCIPNIDYLSTVSGGSYIGSFFGALFVTSKARGDTPDAVTRPDFDPKKPLQSPLGTEAVRRLRDSGRYLTPAGTSDAFFGASVVMRNWVALQLAIGPTVLLAFWILCTAQLELKTMGLFDHGVLKNWKPSVNIILGIGCMAALALVLGRGAAYWLTRRDWIPGARWKRVTGNFYFWGIGLFIAFMSAPWWASQWLLAWVPAPGLPSAFAAAVATIALLSHVGAEAAHGGIVYSRTPPNASPAEIAEQRRRDQRNPRLLISAEDRVRTALSGGMASALMLFLLCLALLTVDRLASGAITNAIVTAKAFFAALGEGKIWQSLASAWPIAAAAGPPLLSFLSNRALNATKDESGRKGRITGRLAGALPTLLVIGAVLLLLLWILLWSAVAHYFFEQDIQVGTARVVLIALVIVNLCQSLSFSFINLSSLSTFYAARLRRAYIGASSYGREATNGRQDDPQDWIDVEGYYRDGIANGAPLHLINVTIAETIAGTSNLVARDRKGKPMHLSPAGLAYEGDTPGTTVARGVRWGEELPLANWIAISGAAVSAAIGSGTSLATSILATLSNVRLGYWWKQDRKRRPLGPLWSGWRDTVQNYLLLELRGAFDGTRRQRWYLTDGGHFENMGVYPLLQRRLPFIIACDNGADPQYRMSDLMRLIGRAKTDLGVIIRFAEEADLTVLLGKDSPLSETIVPLSSLIKPASTTTPDKAIAALAFITYADQTQGKLLLVKPRLNFSEPPEILAYHSQHGCQDFPQQTTGDQFFDEEQWEAYRALGERAGQALFPDKMADQGAWTPAGALTHRLPANQAGTAVVKDQPKKDLPT
ncbi:patatin-like phospholipase family protein [Sphingobium sp. HBC34]|uniref:Patatin-like phospholipase family protein n=1 Tax=Sphingobium cyanobacteriorum TaxID=3063954 RepID=A0ABT8ZR68_9SPHN|nr:patatin-like phospholipase family protein [Sphingobium sp. HBC34]MDO7836200.1 patatin-like phospholipase family protein [Sphingobium sp. HBC34]